MGETLESMEKENIYDECSHFTENCRGENCIECIWDNRVDEEDPREESIEEIEVVLEAHDIPNDTIARVIELIEEELYKND